MHLITDDEALRDKQSIVFKTEGVSSLFWLLIFLTIILVSIGTFLWHYIFEGASLWWLTLLFWFTFWFSIAAAAAWGRFRASLASTNWLMAINHQGLAVRFRSFQNKRGVTTERVVFWFGWQEIASAQHVVEKSAKENRDEAGATLETFHYIKLKLRLPDSSIEDIRSTLKNDREDAFGDFKKRALARRQGQLKGRPRKIITIGNVADYPVMLTDENALLIRWNGVRPNWSVALSSLSKYIDTASDRVTEIDSYDFEPNEQNVSRLVRQRIARGDDFDAIQLLKQHRGYTTTEAMDYISRLKQGE